jgi:hypothetical protein
MRHRHHLSALLASLLSTSALILSAGTATAAERSRNSPDAIDAGVCFGASPETNQKYAERDSSYIGDPYFDHVRGTAKAQQLEVCVGSSSNPPEVSAGCTFVLPANIQSGSGSTIYQVGYGRCAGEGSNYIVYAYGDSTAHRAPNGINNNGIILTDGHLYSFHIYKRSSGRVSYDVFDNNTAQYVWTWYPTASWGTSLSHAWWGYETTDDASDHGHSHGDLDYIRMYAMIYNGSNDDQNHYRQPTASEVICNGTGCASNHHTHISTTIYASDTFDADTAP